MSLFNKKESESLGAGDNLEKKDSTFKRIIKNRIFIAVLFFFIGGIFMAPGTTEDELESQIAS